MKYWTKVRLSIVVTFTLAIIGSYVADQFPDFFGDRTCQGAVISPEADWQYTKFIGCQDGRGAHNPTTHWGYRHWILFWFGASLFFLQLVYIVKLPRDTK